MKKTTLKVLEELEREIKRYILAKHIHFEKNNSWQFKEGMPYINSLDVEAEINKIITNLK